jgi:hypothetical protein
MRNRPLRPTWLASLSRRAMIAVIAGSLMVGGGLMTLASSEFADTAAEPAASGSAAALTGEPMPSAAAAASPTPASTPLAESPESEAEAVSLKENAGGAGGNNIVIVSNRNDHTFRMRGAIQLNRINAPNVAPQNVAIAQGILCTGCETYAVALQINLIGPDTHRAVPANAASAGNFACDFCTTAAEAIQYTLTVDDPMDTPPDVRGLLRAMEAELRDISHEADTVIEAESRVDAIILRFKSLARSLQNVLDVETTGTTGPVDGSPTPSPSASPVPTASPETPTPTPSMTPIPSATVEPTPVPAPSP